VNTHPFDLTFVTFCPKFSRDSYVEFQKKKLFREIFSEIVCKPRLFILYKNLWNFALLFEVLFCVHIALEKLTQVLSYVVCTQLRRHAYKQITKRRYRKKSQDVLFSEYKFCSLLVWDLLRLTPLIYWNETFTRHLSLCVLNFG